MLCTFWYNYGANMFFIFWQHQQALSTKHNELEGCLEILLTLYSKTYKIIFNFYLHYFISLTRLQLMHWNLIKIIKLTWVTFELCHTLKVNKLYTCNYPKYKVFTNLKLRTFDNIS